MMAIGRMPPPPLPLLQVACIVALLLSLASQSTVQAEADTTTDGSNNSTSEMPISTGGTETQTPDLLSTKQSEAIDDSSTIGPSSTSPTQQATLGSLSQVSELLTLTNSSTSSHQSGAFESTLSPQSSAPGLLGPTTGSETAAPTSASVAPDGHTAATGSSDRVMSPVSTDASLIMDGTTTLLAVSSSTVNSIGLQTLAGYVRTSGSAATQSSSMQPAGEPATVSSGKQVSSTSAAEPRSVLADASADGASSTQQPPPSGRVGQCQERKCLHGGTCWITSPGYVCTCPQAYEGTHCETWTGKRYEDLKIALLAVSVASGVIILFLVVALAVVCCTRRTHKEPSAEQLESGLYGNSQIHSWFPSLPRPSIKPSAYGEVSVEMNENLQRRQHATNEQAQVISVKSASVKDGGHSTEGVANDGFTPDDIAKASNAPPAVSHEEPRTTTPVTFGPVSVVTIASTMPRSTTSTTPSPAVPEETTNSSTIPRAVNSAVSPASVSDVRPSLRVSAPASTLTGGSGNRNPPPTRRRDLVYF